MVILTYFMKGTRFKIFKDFLVVILEYFPLLIYRFFYQPNVEYKYLLVPNLWSIYERTKYVSVDVDLQLYDSWDTLLLCPFLRVPLIRMTKCQKNCHLPSNFFSLVKLQKIIMTWFSNKSTLVCFHLWPEI